MVEVIDDFRKVNYTGKHVQGGHYLTIFTYALRFSGYLVKGNFFVENTN